MFSVKNGYRSNIKVVKYTLFSAVVADLQGHDVDVSFYITVCTKTVW